MRTETITIEYYKFDELDKEAKQRALFAIRNSGYYNSDNEYAYKDITDRWEECLEKLGFLNCEINWSGFSSQGYGASFTADIDMLTMTNTLMMNGSEYNFGFLERLVYHGLIGPDIRITRHNNFYLHKKSCSILAMYTWDFDRKFTNKAEAIFQGLMDQFLSDLEEFREEICKKIYAELKEEFDWFNSDESVMEYIESQGYEFHKNGAKHLS